MKKNILLTAVLLFSTTFAHAGPRFSATSPAFVEDHRYNVDWNQAKIICENYSIREATALALSKCVMAGYSTSTCEGADRVYSTITSFQETSYAWTCNMKAILAL